MNNMNKMWIRNRSPKVSSPSDLAAALTMLRQHPPKMDVFFSFENPDEGNIIHIINTTTFPNCDPNIFGKATNIKVWNNIENKSSEA